MKRILLSTVMGAVLALVAIAWTSPALAQTFSVKQYYWTYAVKTKEILQNADCSVAATLQFVSRKNVLLIGSEVCGGIERGFFLEGKMTPSGSLKLRFPDFIPIVSILKAHTGCTVAGPFPKYHGVLQDGVLHVETHFYSQCNEHWPANDIFPTPVDGPVHWNWTIDLELQTP